jgi:hypothetical protein
MATEITRNRTLVSVPAPDVADEPTAYLNPGRGGEPFAVADLGPRLTLFIRDAWHARAIAAAFTKAADLLETADATQQGGAS